MRVYFEKETMSKTETKQANTYMVMTFVILVVTYFVTI